MERAISPYDGIEKEIITDMIGIGYNNPQNFINEPTIMILGKIAIKRYGNYENIKKCDNNDLQMLYQKIVDIRYCITRRHFQDNH